MAEAGAPPPPPPPLPTGPALTPAQRLAKHYAELDLYAPGTPETLTKIILEHEAFVKAQDRPTAEPNTNERTMLEAMIGALSSVQFQDAVIEPTCFMLERVFRHYYSLQEHTDENSPVTAPRDPVRLVRQAKSLRTLRDLHLGVAYNIIRVNRQNCTIQAPDSAVSSTVPLSLLRPASGFAMPHKPIQALDTLITSFFPKLWDFVLAALRRPNPTPTLGLITSIAPFLGIVKPPTLVPAIAEILQNAAAASTPDPELCAAASQTLVALSVQNGPALAELHVRFGPSGFLLSPTEREVNNSHTRYPNSLGRILVHLTPGPDLKLLHLVRAGDSDSITTTLGGDKQHLFSFYARTTPAPGHVPVCTRITSIRIDHPADRKRGNGDFVMYVPIDLASAALPPQRLDSLTPPSLLRIVAALQAAVAAHGPVDSLVRGLRSTMQLLLLLIRDLNMPFDPDTLIATLDSLTVLFFQNLRKATLTAKRSPFFGTPATLANSTYRCGPARRCEAQSEQCSSCSLLQQPEFMLVAALEPVADLCVHLLPAHGASPTLFRAVVRSYSVLEEDPDHDLPTVCGLLRGSAAPDIPALLTGMFTDTLVEHLAMKGADTDPHGHVLPSNFFVGARVIRSDHWHYDMQDGGPGNVGIIIARDSENWVRVRWLANNTDNVYEIENTGNSTLFFADSRPDWFVARNLGAIVRLTLRTHDERGDNYEALIPMVSAATGHAFAGVVKPELRNTLTAIEAGLDAVKLCWKAVQTPLPSGEVASLSPSVLEQFGTWLCALLESEGVVNQINKSVQMYASVWTALKETSNIPVDHPTLKVALTQETTDPLVKRIHMWLRARWEDATATVARGLCAGSKDVLDLLAQLCDFIEAFRPGKSAANAELLPLAQEICNARFPGRVLDDVVLAQVANFGHQALRALAVCWPDGAFDVLSRAMQEAGAEEGELRSFFDVRRTQVHGGDDMQRLIVAEFTKINTFRIQNLPGGRIAMMLQEMMSRLLTLAANAHSSAFDMRAAISDLPWGRVVLAKAEGDGIQRAIGAELLSSLPDAAFTNALVAPLRAALQFLRAALPSLTPGFARAVELSITPDLKALNAAELTPFYRAASVLQRVGIPTLLERFSTLFCDVVTESLLSLITTVSLDDGLAQLQTAIEVLGLLSWDSTALRQNSARALRRFVESDGFRDWLADAMRLSLNVYDATGEPAGISRVGMLLREVVPWQRGLGATFGLGQVLTDTLSRLVAADVSRLLAVKQHNAAHVVDGLSDLRQRWLTRVDGAIGATFHHGDALLLPDPGPTANAPPPQWFRATTALCVRAKPAAESSVIGEIGPEVLFQVEKETVVDGAHMWRCALGWVGPLLGLAEPRGSAKGPAPTAAATVAATPGAKPKSPKKRPAPTNEWECGQCTFRNAPRDNVCSMCEGPRVMTPEPWTCLLCTFVNADLTRLNCEICNAPREIEESEEAVDVQPRGKCTNADCPVRQLGVCAAFTPVQDQTICSYCGCEAEQHKLIIAPRDIYLRRIARQCFPSGPEAIRPLRSALLKRLTECAHTPSDTTHQGLVGLLATYLADLLDVLNTATTPATLPAALQRAASIASMLPPNARRSLEILLLEGATTRLLRGRSRSVEAEYVFAAIFRTVFGKAFSKQLENMLDETSWSRALSQNFAHAAGRKPFQFSATVVSRHNWSFATIFEAGWTPPAALAQVLDRFRDFQHQGHHMTAGFSLPDHKMLVYVQYATDIPRDRTACFACKTVLTHAPDCPIHLSQSRTQLTVPRMLPVALLTQHLLAGLSLSTHTPVQLFAKGRFLLDGSETVGSLTEEPIVAVVAHKGVTVPPAIGLEALPMTKLNAPSFYSNPRATTLTWLPRGQAELEWTAKRVTLLVSTAQMCALLTFNDSAVRTFADLLELTGLGDAVLQSELLALCSAPHEILRASRRRRGLAFSDADEFVLNESFTATAPVVVRTTALAVTRSDASRAAVSLHGHCVDRLDSTLMRVLKRTAAGLAPAELTLAAAHECRRHFIVTSDMVSERLRRLAVDGLVEIVDGIARFVPGDGLAPMVTEGGLSRSVSLDNRGHPLGTAPLLRAESQQPDEAPGLQRLQSVDLAAAAKHELSVLLPTFSMDVASDLAVAGLAAPGPVFCTRDSVLRGFYSTIDRLADCLNISKSHAFAYLSSPEIRWDMRTAVDAHLSKPRPEHKPNKICGLHIAYSDVEGPTDFTFPYCKHTFHRSCVTDFITEHCFGGFEGAKQRTNMTIAGATCPARSEDGTELCNAFIPWFELFESDIFGAHLPEARTRWENEVLTRWAAESPLLQACPGGCGMFAAVSAPPEQTVTIAQCPRCKSSFCFKCKGLWFEDHRPALCDHMTRWGDSIFSGSDPQPGAAAASDDTVLNQMYLFNHTVRCPRCKNRVQKITGCQHLTCGASSYRGTDWRGRGCGLDFCEVCETPLEESKCESSTCRRPDKRARLEEERNKNRAARDHFQKVYMPRAQRADLRAAVAAAWGTVDGADQLETLAEVYIECVQARAHSIVTATLEPARGIDNEVKVIAVKAIETAIEQMQAALVSYLPLRHLGPPPTGWVHVHEHQLRHVAKQITCTQCRREAPAGYTCPEDEGYELCAACFFEHFQPSRAPIPSMLAEKSRTTLLSFFRAFA
eukprot:m.229013 g.229013  ORF g.229013 m.229013 type:complete len:2646 (-) comp17649_c0_seq1:185-8122(-)